jgi:large subunit ribosomal protein L11
MEFCKQYNAQTQKMGDTLVPVVISIYKDRSFTFILKTPPASELIKKAAGIVKGSGVPNKDKVGSITSAQVEEIAKTKLVDLNATSLEAAINIVKGTARSMGVEIRN